MFADFAQLAREREGTDRRILDWAGGVSPSGSRGRSLIEAVSTAATANCRAPSPTMHFFNHGTHHRGQLTTLMKQAGVDPGVTDLPWLPGVVRYRRLKPPPRNKKAPGEESPGGFRVACRARRRGSYYRMKPTSAVANLPMLGKIWAMSTGLAPNHLDSVAPIWSIAVVGIHRPWLPESSGPAIARLG